MAIRVAVVDPLPIFREGVAAALSAAGYLVDAPTELLEWAARCGRDEVVLLTLEGETGWELLGELREAAPDLPVIALLADESAEVGVRAVRAGAQSVLPRRSTAGILRRTVEAAIDGCAVMPRAVAVALAAAGPGSAVMAAPLPQALSTEQVSWLRQLASGATVAELAGQVGYSERAMFRLLRSLYRELGVRNRIQAIVLAQNGGWLHAKPDPAGPAPR